MKKTLKELLTPELLEKLYIEDKLTQKEIGKLLGISEKYVSALSVSYGLSRPKRAGYQKYNTNNSFFKHWSSEMAYILGFILCDGTVGQSNNSISIEINSKDVEILNFIKQNISPEKPIYFRDRLDSRTGKVYSMAAFQFSSLEAKEDLIKFGITPQKTGKEICPDIPKEFVSDFLRGVLDGDGSIIDKGPTINGKKYKAYRVQISSSCPSFLEDLNRKYCFDLGSIHGPNENCYALVFENRPDIKKILSIIYNGNFCLQRKYQKYLDFTTFDESMRSNPISVGTMKGIEEKRRSNES